MSSRLRQLKWVILWSLWAGRAVRQPTAPVLVSNGWVRGSVDPEGYIQYTGIPYATVVNRFQAPGPEPTWDGVFDAVNEHIKCTQMSKPFDKETEHDLDSSVGQDDCLVLNVYRPIMSPGPLPVMVFIHGGAFVEGSSVKTLYGPEYLTNKGVLLVTLNYRLNVPGFLCLGIKEAPGNAAMKDQVAALRWVQRNIRAFGGDPDNVTLFGESAGSASVSFHVVSPMSKGLFHKAIQQSGSSIASWAIQYDPVQTALYRAKALGYTGTSEDPQDLHKFFSSKTDLEIITRLTKRVEGNTVQSRTVFTPCLEKEFDGVEPFLSELPVKLLQESRYNKVPMIIGSNTAEGILFLSIEPNEVIPQVTIDLLMPRNLVYPNPEVRRKIVDDLTKMYMGDDEISIKTIGKLVKFYGEPFFNYPAIEESELILKSNPNPVYSYFFNYTGWRNYPKYLAKSDLKSLVGATHADELFYLFSQYITPSFFESEMIEKMTTMWTNFAKYGNPTPEVNNLLPIPWPALKVEDQQSLIIDQELATASMWYNNSTLPYWKQVFAKYRRKI